LNLIKEEIKNISNTPSALRKFGISVGIVLVIIGSVMFWYETSGYFYFTLAGTFLVFSGIVFPSILKPLNTGWMTIAVILGFVMTRIILMILYYMVLTPISLIAKITGKKFIEKGFDKKKHTYWNIREKKDINPVEYERQF
jgi:cytochrome b subunit of formate dehydrogenase